MKKFLSILVISFFIFAIYYNYVFNRNANLIDDSNTILFEESKPNLELKNKFENIYNFWLWGSEREHGGSGGGSTPDYTANCRSILYEVIKKYKIKSMIDAPCGSMAWMPLLLFNVTNENKYFKYCGVDIVESVINASKIRFKSMSKNWKIKLLDFTQQDLPSNYDLIFSRDALQHLPLQKVVDALKTFSKVKGAKYLLVGSYLEDGLNTNINVGDYYPIDLTKSPFNLDGYVATFSEKVPHKKYLVLYDIPNYLSKIDFEKMKANMIS